MHSKEIRNLNNGESDPYFVQLLLNIKKNVPEFETIYNEDEQYLVVFQFGEFLVNNWDDKTIVKKGLDFINEAISQGTSITYEVIALELFTQFYNDQEKLKYIKQNLGEDAKIVLNYFELLYNKSYPRLT